MIEYRVMDEANIVPYCLHSGPIPLSDLIRPEEARARFEAEKGLPHGPVVEFLRAISRVYGASGVMAIDGDMVIGKIRFAPRYLFGGADFGCVQGDEGVAAIAAVDLQKLPAEDELSPKSLFIWCIQMVPTHRGQGIGTSMLTTAIAWARSNDWEEIHARASRHIRPLMDWTGMLSIDRCRRLGFTEVSHSVHDELRKSVVAMRGGFHGEEVKKQWAPYADLSDDEASWVYEVILNVSQKEETA